MQSVSPAFSFITDHCVRNITGEVSAVYDRKKLDTKPFTWCQSLVCEEDLILCSDLEILPYYDYDGSMEKCRVISIEYTHEMSSPLGSVVKSTADVVLSNNDRKFSRYDHPQYYNCDYDVLSLPESTNTAPGIPFRIYTGFWWKNGCDKVRENVVNFTGLSESFPKIDIENGGNATATFHLVDLITKIESLPILTPMTYSNMLVSDIISSLLNSVGVSVSIPDSGTVYTTVTTELGKTIKDYLYNLVDLEFGRFYQNEYGFFTFETYDYWAYKNNTCLYTLSTKTNVISLQQPQYSDIINYVKVQQFTNPGGIEVVQQSLSSISQYGYHPYTVTNPLIADEDTANSIAQKLLQRYSRSSYQRDVEIVAIPQLQVGDLVCLEERIDTDSRDDCCEPIYQETHYIVKKIYGNLPEDGYIQKLTLTRTGVPLNEFNWCESPVCDFDYIISENCV